MWVSTLKNVRVFPHFRGSRSQENNFNESFNEYYQIEILQGLRVPGHFISSNGERPARPARAFATSNHDIWTTVRTIQYVIKAHLFELERKQLSFHGLTLSSSTKSCSENYIFCAIWVSRLKCLLTSVNIHPCKPQCRSMTCTNFRINPSSLMKYWTATINWHILVSVLCKWSKV